MKVPNAHLAQVDPEKILNYLLNPAPRYGISKTRFFGGSATGGTGLNLFADPAAVFAAFRPIKLSQDTSSSGYSLRGQNRWNFDMALSRQFKVTERASFALSAQFFNVFNHVLFNDPGLSLQNPTAFGVITSQMNSPRRIELGLHIDF